MTIINATEARDNLYNLIDESSTDSNKMRESINDGLNIKLSECSEELD